MFRLNYIYDGSRVQDRFVRDFSIFGKLLLIWFRFLVVGTLKLVWSFRGEVPGFDLVFCALCRLLFRLNYVYDGSIVQAGFVAIS